VTKQDLNNEKTRKNYYSRRYVWVSQHIMIRRTRVCSLALHSRCTSCATNLSTSFRPRAEAKGERGLSFAFAAIARFELHLSWRTRGGRGSGEDETRRNLSWQIILETQPEEKQKWRHDEWWINVATLFAPVRHVFYVFYNRSRSIYSAAEGYIRERVNCNSIMLQWRTKIFSSY